MPTVAAPEHTAGVATPQPSDRPGWRQRLSRADVTYSPYLYIAPFFVLFLVVGLIPLGYTAWVSLHDWRLDSTERSFVGLANFADLLDDEYFWNALGNTFSIFVLSSGPQIVIALGLAVLLDSGIRARSFWRLAVILPYVVTPVAVGIIFGNLFGDRFGLINTVLEGIGSGPVQWHADTLPSHLAIASMVNWRWTGYNALIFLAAMQAIPRELYEAAVVDGANAWRRFISVTIPMLRP